MTAPDAPLAPAIDAPVMHMAAILDWWREAGVDRIFTDEAHGWLASDAGGESDGAVARRSTHRSAPDGPSARGGGSSPREPAAPAPPPLGGARGGWPDDLAGFRQWWLAEPSLDPGPLRARIAPEGSAGAALMILVAQPEAGDEASGRLLSGPQGQLLAAMLRAMGLAEAETYRASVIPRHTRLADWPALEAAGIAQVVAHHVALVRPTALLVFGRSIPSLPGHEPTQKTALLPLVNHEGITVPAMFAPALDHFLSRPQAKAGFWKDWLEWRSRPAESAEVEG